MGTPAALAGIPADLADRRAGLGRLVPVRIHSSAAVAVDCMAARCIPADHKVAAADRNSGVLPPVEAVPGIRADLPPGSARVQARTALPDCSRHPQVGEAPGQVSHPPASILRMMRPEEWKAEIPAVVVHCFDPRFDPRPASQRRAG